MTTTIPTSPRRWMLTLLVALGLVFIASDVYAQSRGSTQGRERQTERAEKKKETPAPARNQAERSGAQQKSSSRSAQQRSGASSQGQASRTARESQSSRGQSRSASPSRSQQSAAGSASRSSGQARTQPRNGSSANNRSSRSGGSEVRTQPGNRSGANNSNTRSENQARTQPRNQSRAGNQSRGSTPNNQGANSQGDARRQTRVGDDSRTRSESRDRGGNGNANNRDNNRRSSEGASTSRGGGSTSNGRGNSRQANRGNGNGQQRGGSARQPERRGNAGNTRQPVDYSNARRRDSGRMHIQPVPQRRVNVKPVRKVYPRKYHHKGVVYVQPRIYVNPVSYYRPHVHINVSWPWQSRYHRHWRPRYRYRQVVYVKVGWGGSRYREARVDLRTDYSHRVKFADHNKAVVDIFLERVEVYENGYFLGEVTRIPNHLSHIEATIYRNGDIVYDRDVFLVGDSRAGFEMIATPHYDGYVMDHYSRGQRIEVGELDFRRRRVEPRQYSRLFDPYDFNGFAPITLLPEDDQLLADYGYDSLSYGYYDDRNDPYYGGRYDEDYYDYDDRGGYSRYDRPSYGSQGIAPYSNGGQYFSQEDITAANQPLTLRQEVDFQTKQGVAIRMEREAELQRLQ